MKIGCFFSLEFICESSETMGQQKKSKCSAYLHVSVPALSQMCKAMAGLVLVNVNIMRTGLWQWQVILQKLIPTINQRKLVVYGMVSMIGFSAGRNSSN